MAEQKKVNAIILAGTHKNKSRLISGKNKAFLEINNQSVILSVLSALQNSDGVDNNKIAIVGPKKDLEKKLEQIININPNIQIVPQGKTLVENICKAYDHLSSNGEKTLFLPCDLPFINSRTIDNFLTQCHKYDAKFYCGFTNVEKIPKEVEQFKKTWRFHLKDKGYFRTGNMVLYENSGIENRKPIELQIRKLFENRRAVSLLTKVNMLFSLIKFSKEIVKYLTIGLTIKDTESAIKREFKIPFKLIETDARACADIDYQKEYEHYRDNYQKMKDFSFQEI